MEELDKIKNIIIELGFEIKNIEKNEILINSPPDKETLIKIDKRKPKTNIPGKKIVVISPFIARRIEKEALEKILEEEEKISFVNKNSLEKIYPSAFLKVVNYLKQNPNSYISKISKDLKLHPEKVRRILLKLRAYIEVKSFENKNLPKLPKIVSLREELSEEKIRELVKNKIEIVSEKKKKKKKKKNVKYEKITKEEALKLILKFIEENPNTHLREISRKLKINPAIVHSCLKEVSEFIEVLTPTDVFNFELPNIPIQIKIKDGYDAKGIIKVIKIKKMLNDKEFKI